MTNSAEARPGLRDVIAGQTEICKLDEQVSKIYLYGYPVEELVENNTYEEVAYLTLFGELPAAGYRFAAPDDALLESVWRTMQTESQQAHPMGLLRTAMSALGNRLEADNVPHDYESERDEAIRFVPNVGYLTGLIARHMTAANRVSPDGTSSYAENLLTMIHDRRPSAFEAACMNLALTLYTEHEFNAGSFAVRIAASAHSDIYSSALAGECVLRGPRHGSANEESMKLMLDIGEPGSVRPYCDRFFEAPGARMPGFGHAVYNLPHSVDPRVTMLRPWVKELSRIKGDTRWYEIAIALEEYMGERMKPRVEKGAPNAPANMDLWTAPLYYLLDIPISMYTPLFAASRIAGWCAHYLETRYVNNEPIIRPRAEYAGPEPHEFKAADDHGASKAPR